MSKLGIDVSYHQGKIDWQKVKAEGIDFAILRAGYGKSNVDKQFKNNVNGCIENNIPFGVYWFIYGVNPAEAVQNAVKCHETIKQYKDKISMRVWCDLEYDTDRNAQKRGFNLTKEVRTEMVIAFCEKMKEYGYSVGNYANPDYLNNKLNDLSQYPLWLARYSTTKGNYECEMWQYSSKGSIPGINGNVDMNYFYTDFNLESEKVEMVKPTCNINILEFQKSANADGYKDQNGKKLVEDGLDGAKTQYVRKQIVLKAKKTALGYKVGSKGALVKWIQRRCNEILGTSYTVDGLYGKDTRKQVMAVQRKLGLAVDGIAGYNTIQALFYN